MLGMNAIMLLYPNERRGREEIKKNDLDWEYRFPKYIYLQVSKNAPKAV